MIELDEREQELFRVLLASVKNKHKETVLRVAGGWVRDKILKQQSVDIDIALNDQSGVEFAASLNEYLLSIGKETRTIAVIQANPDQSKHLETANVRVMGYEIDCVNLRAETYTDSRIPEIRNGTALEDALRRDFTINALFYNLNTNEVEDLTGRGLDDLNHGIIRTPISAHVTFRDDPLRVLRAIRFASRFQFVLDQELLEAGSSAEIRAALRDKVSRERVYKECEGCMSKENSRPYLAFHLINRLSLFDVVLPVSSVLAAFPLTRECAVTVPDMRALLDQWVECSLHSMHWLNVLISGRESGYLWSSHRPADAATVALSKETLAQPKFGASVKMLFWAAATCALRKLQVTEKGKVVPLVPVLLREGLKMENATMKSVQIVLDCIDQFDELSMAASVSVETAGLLLRTCKEQWRDCILMACARELSRVSQYPAAHPDAPLTVPTSHSGVKRHLAEACADQQGAVDEANRAKGLLLFADVTLSGAELQVINRFVSLETAIDGMGLDNVWQLKPLMNGSELIAQLGLPKGPLVGKLVEQQTIWQLRNLHSTDKAACIDFLRSIVPSIL